ncbi:hypothetical protein [Myxococcus qinghaiensis]|uniref:hypothetical protein n=1 Tax=Myxococcus qinghaiensis TaxID=2906758 RepID=UPI0020A6F220|nr:hypothetical protein [Myxococcus qinghaiensis]MCP3169267.1 hypothetical protein [Myxococcus qinghaiensis]
MTSPLSAALPMSLPPQPARSEKLKASWFDGVPADNASRVQPPSAPQEVASVGGAAPVTRMDGTMLNGISRFVQELEQGQRVLDHLIRSASSGPRDSSTELLSLKASMYRYAEVLDLVSRIASWRRAPTD